MSAIFKFGHKLSLNVTRQTARRSLRLNNNIARVSRCSIHLNFHKYKFSSNTDGKPWNKFQHGGDGPEHWTQHVEYFSEYMYIHSS